MTIWQQAITIAMVALGTQITRFIVFALFPAGKPTPAFIVYMGKLLPGAVFGLLVVYCLKDVQFTSQGYYGAAELLGILATCVIHLLKRSMMLSIAGGTTIYILLLHYVFC